MVTVRTWITTKEELATFALEGYLKEFASGQFPRLFLGVDPYGNMSIYNVDAHFGKDKMFHEEDGPLHLCREYVRKHMFHTAAVGFPTDTCLVLFSQDMTGCDRHFAILNIVDYSYDSVSVDLDVHISDPQETLSFDLYQRSPRYNPSWTENFKT